MERFRNYFFRRSLRGLLLVPLALGFFILAGCSDDDDDDDNGTPATQTTMNGSLAGGTSESGTLAVTIQSGTLAGSLGNRAASTNPLLPASKVVVAAVGTLDLEGIGGTHALAGTYNTDTDSLFLSGDGYTLRGKRTNTGAGQVIEGLYTGPNGSGAFFALAGAGVPLQSYCGAYTSGAQTDSGFVALTVRGSSVTGFVLSELDSNDIIRLNGTITGTGTVRDIDIEDPTNPGGAPLAEGTWNTSLDTMSGTYGFGGDTGTWEATLCD